MKNLTLLSMGLMIYSCNEKISPELESGSSTTIPSSSNPTDYYFKVENSSAAFLNYKLHRTGAGNQSANCEVTSNSNTYGQFSSENYNAENIALPGATAWDSKEFDISCYFEAEELSLFYSGFDFTVSASKNSCAYVGYSPFSFYDQIPGSSSTTYTNVTCDEEAIDAGVGTAATTSAATAYDMPAAGNLDCGQYVDNGFAAGTAPNGRLRRVIGDETELCEFNYTNANCDEGIITIIEQAVSYTPAVPDDATTPLVNEYVAPITIVTPSTRTVNCGGDHMNCIAGPINLLPNKYDATSVDPKPTVADTVYTRTLSYDGSYPNLSSNKQYVNFRRDLANADIDFQDSDHGTLLAPVATYITNYVTMFATPETAYNPILMDLYSYNLRWDALTEVIDTVSTSATAGSLAEQTIINGYTARPYAAEPFLGFGDHKTNPFYTFYCFDQAYEIKARIRMVVREWDRIFPTNKTSLSYISDIGSLTNSRQDYAFGQPSENPGDPDSRNAYNDLLDWDDYLFMLRTGGPTVPAVTLWEPKSGFFNSAIFTNGSY